jgi:hypothetical protein
MRFFSFFTLTLIFSCNTKQPDKVVTPVDTTAVVTVDTAVANTDSHYFWCADEEAKNGFVVRKNRELPPDSLNETNIIGLLNGLYPEIPLSFTKISHDSIFLKIRKSAYLTQQMGSTGADQYIAEVTYNLTELKGINFVNLSFKEGDHASPGTYSRTDFVQVGN